MPTELGELIIEQMEQFFPEILDVEFTAHMEGDLDHVEEGAEDWVRVLAGFYESFEKRLEFAEEEMKEIEIEDEVSDELCEKCGKPMVYKLGRFGKFLACSGFPDCRNTKPIVKDIGVTCPKCNEGKVVERRSKKDGCSMGVTSTLAVILFPGTVRPLNHVLLADRGWWKSATSKEPSCNALPVITRKQCLKAMN